MGKFVKVKSEFSVQSTTKRPYLFIAKRLFIGIGSDEKTAICFAQLRIGFSISVKR